MLVCLEVSKEGDTTPTITTLDKIANGFKVQLSKIIEEEKERVLLIRSSDKTVYKNEKDYEVLTAVKYNKDFGFQILELNMSPNSVRQSQGHNKGVVEFLLIQEGAVKLTLEGKEYDLGQGDIIRFEADQPHVLENKVDVAMRATNIIYYNKI